MKKLLIIIGVIIGFLLLAVILVPVIFKDDIRAAVDKALAESVNADFVFETEDFSVSIIKHFPNPTANLKNFGIINRAPFDGEIFFATEELEVVIGLMSLISGDQIKIKGIAMQQPRAFLKVLEDGTTNWDIAIDTDMPTETADDTAAVNYNIGIEHWEINNGEVEYVDRSLPLKLIVKGLNHEGSGDFTQDIIDISTHSLADSITVTFDGVEYITNKKAEIDMAMRISENFERYDFEDNKIRINDFVFGFDGGYKMLPDGLDLDLTFTSQENSFKSLLSLVPGMYHDDFDRIDASGQLQFQGMVNGKYDSLQMPAFDIALKVDDASFKYPEVDEAFSDIQVDMHMKNETNNLDNTRIAINQFHLLMGDKPFDGKLIVENLRDYPLDAAIKGSIDLEDLSRMVPMEGMNLRGLLDMDITANGRYDTIQQVMPKLEGLLTLNNGFIKSSDFPSALENFNVNAEMNNTTGAFSDFIMNLSQFSFIMDGEPFEGKMTISDLSNYTWDVAAKGNVDLEKIAKIMSLEDMELSGRMSANIQTKGNMTALDAERYDQLPTSGTVVLTNFRYSDDELPYAVTLSETNATFNPQRMDLTQMKGTVGRSDFDVNGYVSNYIGYILSDDQVLKGSFDYTSNNLDLNEFMDEEEDAPTVDEEEMGVIEIPKNIDMTFNGTITKVIMMDMVMNNVIGKIIARDGVATMENVNFNLLDGQFAVNGSYDSRDLKKPAYDFGLKIKDLSVREAFQQFEIVKNYVPIAEKVTGKFSTDFNLNGLLTQAMSPDLATINGAGLVELLQATLKDSKIVEGIRNITKLRDSNDLSLDDMKFKASIDKGRLIVEPFTISLFGHKTEITGNTGLDGSINFMSNITVPAGQAAQVLNQFTGKTNADQTITLPVVITGTYSEPRFGLETSEMKDEITDAAKDRAKDEAREGVTEVLDKTIKDDKLKDAVGNILGNKSDTLQRSDTLQKADTTKQDLEEKVQEEAKETIRGLFNKKKGGNK